MSADITDPGAYQPTAPVNVRATLRGTVTSAAERRLDLTWSNPVPYDFMVIAKVGRTFAPYAVGTTTMVTDPDPGSLPQEYAIVGWKNGMPSRSASVNANAGVDDPGVARAVGLCVRIPNPFRSGVTLRFSVSAMGPAELELFDPQGRRVRALQVAVGRPGVRDSSGSAEAHSASPPSRLRLLRAH